MKIKLLSEQDCKEATEYVLELNRSKKIISEGPHRFSENNRHTRKIYMDPFFCSLALQVQPKLESVSGYSLYPTYCYTRLYLPGYTMHPHLDRPACELSSSLTIGYGGRDTPWELYIEDDNGDEVEFVLEPGEGLLYRGRDYHHWRWPLDRGWQIQTFVHYMIVNGEVHQELKDAGIHIDLDTLFTDFNWSSTKGWSLNRSRSID